MPGKKSQNIDERNDNEPKMTPRTTLVSRQQQLRLEKYPSEVDSPAMGMSPEMKRNTPLVNDAFSNRFGAHEGQSSRMVRHMAARTVPSFVSDGNETHDLSDAFHPTNN